MSDILEVLSQELTSLSIKNVYNRKDREIIISDMITKMTNHHLDTFIINHHLDTFIINQPTGFLTVGQSDYSGFWTVGQHELMNPNCIDEIIKIVKNRRNLYNDLIASTEL